MPNHAKLELLNLENQLSTVFHPDHITNTLTLQPIELLKAEMNCEARRIICEFKNANCKQFEEYHLERYIQAHQREAIHLMDLTRNYMQSLNAELFDKNAINEALDLYRTITNRLKDILDYIEKEQCKYFDLSLCVADSYRIGSAELLNSKLNLLKAKLKSKDTDSALQEIIISYITEHCNQKTCSYQQLIYAKLLMDGLLNLLSVNLDQDWNTKIMERLAYMNFNTISFFTYYRSYIATIVGAEKTYSEQLEQFSWFAKEIKQIHVKPNVACKTGNLNLSEWLIEYISLELDHIAGLQSQIQERQPVKNLNERAGKYDYKLPLNLSVDQLALFIELFIRIEIVSVEKGKTMTTMHFFAEHITTIGTGNISPISLNKNRKPSPRTIDWMREILRRMMIILEELSAL